MKQGLISWSPCRHFFSLPSPLCSTTTHLRKIPKNPRFSVSATLESSVDDKPEELTARERRRMRNERRENKVTKNWREEVEERLLKKPKKRYKSWTEELNLDNLSLLGPQWWVIRVSRVSGQETAERLAWAFFRNFPDIEFKVYAPAVQVKRKLKNGSYSIKPKPLFPGCVFLRCVLNKELHDFIRECDGVGGFIGSKVGNIKRQINKPRPVSADDIEAIFRQAKEEQETTDKAFEEQEREETLKSEQLNTSSDLASKDVKGTPKSKRRSRKASDPLAGNETTEKDDKVLLPGATVRVISGSFAEFSGTLKKLDRKTRMVSVGFTLFGKETVADLDINEIVAETK